MPGHTYYPPRLHLALKGDGKALCSQRGPITVTANPREATCMRCRRLWWRVRRVLFEEASKVEAGRVGQ